MSDLREAAEALLDYYDSKGENIDGWTERFAELRQALEAALKPGGEPVAFMYTAIHDTGTTHGPYLVFKPGHMDAMSASKGAVAVPLYTAPPAQTKEN